MRIVLDLQACQASSTQRGIGRYSIALAQAMARNSGSHDLRVVLNARFADSVAVLRRAFDGVLPTSQISTYELPSPVWECDKSNAWRLQAAERIREHHLATLRPAIVHVSSLFEGLGDDAVASVQHGDGSFDTAVTLYDLIPLMRKEKYLSNPTVSAWYYRKLQSLKNADLLLAISGHSRHEALSALQLAPDQVVNISSAVDSMFRPRQPDPAALAALRARYGLSRPYIMYTGGIDYRKNLEGLIDAYAGLPQVLRAQYQLAIVCKIVPADRLRLSAHAEKQGLTGDDLVLTDFVPDDDLVSLYNDTALFVFPSLQEGFGLPALEAMACGAPVIGSNNSSIPEVIGRADALFDPASAGQISASMAKVLTEPAFAASLRAHGLEQAKKFSWDATAKAALAAFEQVHRRRADSQRTSVPAAGRISGPKPRLAYVSPLPPERSGIASYSAELLPELALYYEIDLILAQDGVNDVWASSNFPQRSLKWFDQHAHQFDYIVYQFGNSSFHQHMFGLLQRHPGIVVLHDFYLSGLVSYAEAASGHPNDYCRTLYLAHGYRALWHERKQGRLASKLAYPCNQHILEHASGVIVHSAYSFELAEQWYGPGSTRSWRKLPHLRALPGELDRTAVRRKLGFDEQDFLLCSFGMLAPTKCNDRIVEAWIASTLDADPRCHLVFVGENTPEQFGVKLAQRIASHPRIRITGFADADTYRNYLGAADAAVQLRAHSRGETSGAALDCLGHRLPTIMNAHGSAAELPADACLRLDDLFSQEALIAAMELLRARPDERERLSAQAGRYMAAVHHPARVGALYRDAIESLSIGSEVLAYRKLLASIAGQSGPRVAQDDLYQAAACIAANQPVRRARQILIDVGSLTGRQAAGQRELLKALLLVDTAGWRVEPIRKARDQYRYARRFTLDLIERADLIIDDAVVEVRDGDLLLERSVGRPDALPPLWSLRGVLAVRPESDAAPASVPGPLWQALTLFAHSLPD